eukprot:820551-Pleurochrysis_carterae.AAC.1
MSGSGCVELAMGEDFGTCKGQGLWSLQWASTSLQRTRTLELAKGEDSGACNRQGIWSLQWARTLECVAKLLSARS